MVGAQEQQVDVDLDVAALAQFGITAADVNAAIGAQNALVPAGDASIGGRFAQIDPAAPLRVGDLAHVTTGYPDPPQELVHVDGMTGIALAVAAKETSSVTDLGPEIERLLQTARADWPVGTRVALIADQPRTVNDRIGDFLFNLALAIAIVTALVALFMGPRNGVLVGFTVVLSIVLTFGYMKFVAVDINQISILALMISLGIIVDAGIVSIDNIEHHLRAGLPREEAAARGVGDLWLPLLTSTLVAMSSFLPFRLMGGGIGDFVRDLGVVTSIALAMSLLVAYFVTPILGVWFAQANAGTGRPARSDRLLGAMRRAYVPVATAALQRPVLTVSVAALALVAALAYAPRLGVQFFPPADRPQFFIDVSAAEGTDTVSTQIREADRQTPVIVRLPAALRADAQAFGTLAVRNGSGAVVPLDEFATIAPATQTSITTLRDGARTVTVMADVAGGALASDVLAAFRQARPMLDLPPDVGVSYAGEDEQTTKSFRNLLVAVVVGLLINQMVLLCEFRRLRLSLVVLCAVPLGVVGAILGLALTGQHFGFIASLGISSLGGIVTNHAIVLFEYAGRDMQAGEPMERALILAGTKRLRPIALTVIASIAGLLPLAFPAQTLWRPFCWAVIFGLGVSMAMTLVAIPAIYSHVAGERRARRPVPAQRSAAESV